MITDEKLKVIRKDRISSIALGEAIKYSLGAAAVAGSLTVLATLKNKNFSRFMSISAKTSLPVMAALGTFGYKYEMVQYDAIQHPENWGLEEYVAKGKVTKMPVHHQVLNYLYDHPFYFVSAVGFPFAGYIFKEQLKNTHLTFSQKVMHSRVFAQGGVLLILLSTMAFTGYMDKHGRFPEPDEEISLEETVDYSAKTAATAHRIKK